MADHDEIAASDIAIIGLAAHLPGAGNVAQFWENLSGGVESIRALSIEDLESAGVAEAMVRHPDYVRAGAPLANLDRFDAGFFGMSPKEAAIMDPQQRHFLECAWEAMEHAGYPPGAFQGPVGVFAGSGPNSYLIYNLLSDPELVEREGIFLLRHTGNDKDVLATRVSYQMNLRGPSINVQTACSTSLVAVHLACQSLLNQECDLALAGASSIELPHAIGYLYRESEILSRDGHCRAFDAQATGTVFGSGAGAVVLRRLRDAIPAGDAIHAVIKGSAINNDGSRKVGYLAPSVEGQIDVVSEALAVAGVDPCSVDYVEAHGTGTSVGDPIELTALGHVFGKRERKLAVGSVKTNIGHLDTAAGMAGLIKTVLALRHRHLPPTLHFRTPNPRIDFDRMNVRVVDRLEEWARVDGPRRAGVTSLGIGGTNAHVVLEEAPELTRQPSHRPVALLTLSARSPGALEVAAGNLARQLALDTDPLDDVAYTLHVGRSAFVHRRAVVSADSAEAVRALESNDAASVWTGTAPATPRSVAFLFTGQGSQYVSAGRTLYATEPVFRRWLDECAALARPHLKIDIRDILYPASAGTAEAAEAIRQTWNTQPILFALEYALAQMWMSWGIRPARVIGHSIGEYAAACIAGVFTLEDALSVVSQRGLLMRELEGGSMLAVGLPEMEVAALATRSVSLAAVNAPDQCVLSGPSAEIDPIERALVARGVPAQRLRTSHAFHSRLMDPVLERFTEVVRRARLSAPRIPLLSNVTGATLSDAEATDPAYWARHLRQAVRFGEGVATLLAEPEMALLEIGPGETLAGLARLHPAHEARQPIFSSLPRAAEAERDAVHAQATLGRLWVCGAAVDWRGYHAHEQRRRVALPTYPFERQRHWLGPRGVGATAGVPASVDQWMQRRTWARSALPATAAPAGRWLIYTDSGGIGQTLCDALRRHGVPVTTVALGDTSAPSGTDGFVIDPASDSDHDALIARVAERGWPGTVVHLWALDERGAPEDRCFHSLRALVKGLGQRAAGRAVSIAAVSRRSVSVAGELVLDPTGALLSGPLRVAPQEFQELRCRQIDVDSATPEAIARLLISEMSETSAERLVAYRDGVRWREGFVRRRLESQASRLRRRGVYLITGGTGGLGSAVADWLARSYAARLILVSRDAESLAAAHQARTADWEKAGAELLFCSADTTNLAAMRQAIARGRERFGELHGVVHAAGVLDDGVIELKTRESADRVLAPKVRGVRVLDELLRQQPLDFLALFSSVSSAIPPAGQVDYCSANAYLDAFAESCAPERNVVSIGWGPWSETGMAAPGGGPSATSAIRHPLLDRLEHQRGTVATYAGALSLDRHWIVREHRFHGGDALFPGTGHLDVAVSAAWQTLGQAPLVLRDVVFLAPLRVAPGTAHPFRAELTRTEGGYRFAIADEQSKFVTGFCGRSESAGRRVDLTSLLKRCADGEILQPVNVRQNGHFDFGPRWHNLQRIAFGDGECLATLELPAEYHEEAKEFSLHPALLDMATGAAMFLVPGFERPGDLLLPFSYTRMEVFGQLPPRVYSHARMRPTTGTDLLSFDITVADEHGAVLVEVEEFTVKRLAGMVGVAASAPNTSRGAPRPEERSIARPPRIGTSDGLTALGHILSAKSPGVVFVSPTELQSEPDPVPAASPATAATAAIEGDVERALAVMWQRLLGLEQVESGTDFFAAGGHSLVAVRLFAEIRKRFGVDLGLSTLFEARTLGALASLIRAAQQPSVSRPAPSRPPGLVSIRVGGAKPPLFLLHNIGGRALIYEALARYVPADQPLFGIEALGFHGSYPDHSVPEMATHYIALMRAVQPEGPYFVAGHSFGGVVAYEIGRQLLAQGQQVGMIGILDTLLREAPTTEAAPPSTAATTRRRLRALLFGEGRREFLTVAIASRARKLVQFAYRQMHRTLHGRGRRVPSFMRSVEQACWVASHDYAPPRSDARILLFRCQLRSRWDHPDFLMGWGDVAAGGVDVCEVPGDHLSMVSAPGVEVVATRLAAVITQVSGMAPRPTHASAAAPGSPA